MVEFLLERGADLRASEPTGQTGLHWAGIGGQVATIEMLLGRGAPLEAMNRYGGTVLDQAIVDNGDGSLDYLPVIERLLAAGAKVELYPGFKRRSRQF